MFWQIVLFIIITFGAGFVRAAKKVKLESNDSSELVAYIFWLIVGIVATWFYVPWAITWVLDFLFDYELSYWLAVGAYYAYRQFFMPFSKKS